MNPITISKATVAPGIAALLLSSAFAIEAPADNAPPPAEADRGQEPRNEAPGAAIGQKAGEDLAGKAFLGILTVPIPDMVAGHLGIEPGQGVAVKTIAPDGPAAKAGIEANDIITHIGEKPVASQADVASIIGEHKPGDSIRIDLIKKGRKDKLDLALGTRPAGIDAPEEDMPRILENLPLEGIPKEMADRIRDNIKGNIGGIQLGFGNGGIDPGNLDDLRKRMEKMEGMNGFKGMLNIQGGFQSSMSFKDEKGSVEMKSTNDSKEITVRDPDGKVVWSGPWDTEQDKEAAPPEVRQRIDSFNLDKAGLRGGMFKFGPGMIRPKADRQNDGKGGADDGGDAPE